MSKIEVRCDYCGKIVWKREGDVAKNRHHFCSKKCMGRYFHEHPSQRSRRDKPNASVVLEYWAAKEKNKNLIGIGGNTNG
jgi:hypothetical protein